MDFEVFNLKILLLKLMHLQPKENLWSLKFLLVENVTLVDT